MRDFTQDIRDLQRRLGEAANYLSIVDNRERFAVLEAEIADPELWNDQDHAKKLNAEYANVRDDLETFVNKVNIGAEGEFRFTGVGPGTHGVSIAPWAVESLPARAAPSRASMTKEKPRAIA